MITTPAPAEDKGVTVMDFNSDETQACTNSIAGILRVYNTTKNMSV